MQDTFVASSSVKLESKSSIFNKIKSIVHYSLKVFLNFFMLNFTFLLDFKF